MSCSNIMSYKVVENYQLSESSSYSEDGIDIYIATHNVTKLPYLLKKVNTKDNSDRAKYQSLINEISILKILSHPSVVECHKMLKTSNNIYLVYDYCEGARLSEIIASASRDHKLTVALQILQVMRVLAKASVVHGNIKPTSVMVSHDNKIKLMNFTYGHNREGKLTIPAKFRPPASAYVAPELAKDGLVHEKTDHFSLGVILSELNLGDSSTLSINSLHDIVQRLMSANPADRPDLEEVETYLQGDSTSKPGKTLDSQDRKSMSPSALKKTSSISDSKSSDRKFNPTEQSRAKEKLLVQQILKKRNLAIFLLRLSQSTLKLYEGEDKLGILLGLLFLKKSSKIIGTLLGFLKGQQASSKFIVDPTMSRSERLQFQKKADYFTITTVIQKQSGNQKRWLEDIEKSVMPELPGKYQEVAEIQNIDNKTLAYYVVQFLKLTLVSTKLTEPLSKEQAQNLYLMSEIVAHGSYEDMFEELISHEKTSLEEQPLYLHFNNTSQKQLLSEIGARVQAHR